MAVLADLSSQVTSAADPRAQAVILWKTKPKESFSEVRTALEAMAGGRERCMYCEDNEGTDIEHFWPKSRYPDKAFSWANYLLACSHCNSNHKRAKFPVTNGEPDLLDPTVDEPSHHLRLLPSNGKYHAIGSKGQPSIEVFDLNGDARGRKLPQGRRDTLSKLQVLLLDYDDLVRRGDHTAAHERKRTIINEPFPAVLRFLVELSRQPGAELVLRPGVAQAIQRHRVTGW
jgi:uncharacterized protein (TIGR02646 family)